MASINRVILIGNLGAEPETRYTSDGSPICNIRIATSERWKDKKTGENKESTEWHRVVFYRRLAEIAAQYLHKGSPVYVEGRLRTRKWTDKQGMERQTTEIEADDMQMLGAPERSQRSGHSATPSSQGSIKDPWEENVMETGNPFDDEYPF